MEQSRAAPFFFQKFYQFGPKFWDRSNGQFPAFFISRHNLFNKSSNMAPKQPLTSRLQILGFNKFNKFGPKFWDRSNGRSRPQTNRNIEKHLKEGIKPSREKPLPFGVCQKLTKPESTRSLLCVERLSFSAQRLPTV